MSAESRATMMVLENVRSNGVEAILVGIVSRFKSEPPLYLLPALRDDDS
jgi:hypothetical protein